MSQRLPQNWKQARLGDVCDLVMGQSPPSETYNCDHEGLPFLQGKAEFTELFPRPVKFYTSPLRVARKGSTLMSVRAAVGEVNLADQDYIIGRGLASIALRHGNGPFLFFYLLYAQCKIAAQGSGTTFQSINKAILEQLEILIPPLPEQRAIARALRAVQQAKEARRREAALERERKAALMEHLFTHGTRGEATKQTEIGEMPASWDVCPLGSIAEVAYGLTVNASRRKSADLAPYLAVANVTRGAIKLDNVKTIGMLEGDAERYRLQKGDVLLVEGNGNPRLLGSAAIWNAELPFLLHQNHLIRARLDQLRAVPEWIMGCLNSVDGRSQLLGKAKTSSGLHSINSRLIAGLQIPLPPLEEQKGATNLLRACDAKIAVLELEGALLDELFRALLEELMTGRLSAVPLIDS